MTLFLFVLLQLHFPAGVHHITEPITITEGQRVMGEGKGVTVFLIDTPNGYGFICNLGPRPRIQPCSFSNFTIDSEIERTGGAGILFMGSPPGIRHVVEKVHIKNQMTGIHFADAVAFTFKDSIISHPRPGGNGVIIQSRFEPDAGDSVIDNVLFNDNNDVGQAAIYHIDSGGLNVVNSKALGFQYGYILAIPQGRNTGQLYLSGNSWEHQRLVNVALYGSGGYDQIQILGDHFTVKRYGIIVEHRNRGLIQGNILVCTEPGTGIFLHENVSDFDVLDNPIFDCQTKVTNLSPTSSWDGVH